MNFGSKFVFLERVSAASSSAAATSRAVAESFGTNVLTVKFDVQKTPAQMHTGDVIRCISCDCRAALSHISKLTPADELNPSLKVHMHSLSFC